MTGMGILDGREDIMKMGYPVQYITLKYLTLLKKKLNQLILAVLVRLLLMD